MNVSLRRPLISEADDLAALHVRCWQESYAGLLDAEFLRTLDPAYRAAIWRKVIPDPAMFARVAEVDGEEVGFVMSGPVSVDYRQWAGGEVHALYLLRKFQGRGIGRQLLAAAFDNWRGQGGVDVVAMVFSENQPARCFYEARGGVAAGALEIELGGRKLVEVAYVFAWSGSGQ